MTSGAVLMTLGSLPSRVAGRRPDHGAADRRRGRSADAARWGRELDGSPAVVVGLPFMRFEPPGAMGFAGHRGWDCCRVPFLLQCCCKSFVMSNLPATPPRQIPYQLGR